MISDVKATYSKGAIMPLAPLDIEEGANLRITIEVEPPTDEGIPYAEKQRRAHEIYNGKVRPLLAPADADKYVMIDILTGDYEIGENRATLIRVLRDRRPDAIMHCIHRHQSYGERIRSPRRVRKTEETA